MTNETNPDDPNLGDMPFRPSPDPPSPKRGRKKAAATPEDGARAYVWPKESLDWNAMLAAVQPGHWRTLLVTITVNDKLCAGKPARLDVAKAMLAARGLDDKIEAVPEQDPERQAEADAVAEQEAKCEFHRRPNKPGIWMPASNVKACLKENWSVLGFRVEHRGSRGALAEGVFVFGTDEKDPEWIYLGPEPHGEHVGVVHAMTPQGPRTSIKRREYINSGSELSFLIKIAKAIEEKLPPQAIVETLYHAQHHGLGADRSQGMGTFTIKGIAELTA